MLPPAQQCATTNAQSSADQRMANHVDGWRCIAIADYKAAGSEEISFNDGDTILVETKNANGWWIGTNAKTANRGILPGSYVKVHGPAKVAVPSTTVRDALSREEMLL